MKKQYTWEFEKDEELWGHDNFDTVEECVADYLENYASESPADSIFVGEAIPFIVDVNGRAIIENIEEDAYDECGEIAEDWKPSTEKTLWDWDDLDEQLSEVVCNWLKKHNDIPTFYNVEDIREVCIQEKIEQDNKIKGERNEKQHGSVK